MKINNLIKDYYIERKNNNSKLFKRDNKISIHEIINYNSNIKFIVNNDIHLLKMVIKNKKSLQKYFNDFKFDTFHKRRFFNFKKWGFKLGNNKANDLHYNKIKNTFLPYEVYISLNE